MHRSHTKLDESGCETSHLLVELCMGRCPLTPLMKPAFARLFPTSPRNSPHYYDSTSIISHPDYISVNDTFATTYGFTLRLLKAIAFRTSLAEICHAPLEQSSDCFGGPYCISSPPQLLEQQHYNNNKLFIAHSSDHHG